MSPGDIQLELIEKQRTIPSTLTWHTWMPCGPSSWLRLWQRFLRAPIAAVCACCCLVCMKCVQLCRRFRKRKGVSDGLCLGRWWWTIHSFNLFTSRSLQSTYSSRRRHLSLYLSSVSHTCPTPPFPRTNYNSTNVLHSLVPAVGGRGTGIEQCAVTPFNHMPRYFLRHRKRPHHTHVQRPAKDTIPAR